MIQTSHYLFDAFLDGDIYSAISDKHRFSTVDNELWTMAEIVGDGKIEGWEITSATFPQVKVTKGSGIINGRYVNTYNDIFLSLDTNSTEYIYAELNDNLIGSDGPRSVVYYVTYSDIIPPVPPSYLILDVPGGELINLSWGEVTEIDFDYYAIERSNDGITFETITTLKVNYYNDTDVIEGQTYYYRITAYDLSGNHSSTSIQSIYVDIRNINIPDVTSVEVIPAEKSINVLWEYPETLSLDDINHYIITVVQLDVDHSPILATLHQITVPNYSLSERITNLSNGENYQITIEVIDSFGRSSLGIIKTTTPRETSAPTDPIAIVYSEQSISHGVMISLSWLEGDDPYQSTESFRYKIYVTIDGQLESKAIEVPIGYTEESVLLVTYDYVDYSIIPEKTLVTFRLTALDEVGHESYGNYLRFITSNFTVPQKVLNISSIFNSSDNSIMIKWDLRQDTEKIKLVIWDKIVGSLIPESEIFNEYIGKTNRYLLSNIIVGHQYSFYIYACTKTNICGDPVVTRQTIMQDTTIDELPLPAPPSRLSIAEGDGQLALSWDPSSTAYIDKYKLYRKIGPISPRYALWALLDILGKDITTFTDYGLKNGTTYSYYMTAVDIYGRESLHLINNYSNLNYVNGVPKMQGGLTEPYACWPNTSSSCPHPALSFVGVNNNVLIQWYADNQEFNSFGIYRSINNLHSWEQIASVNKYTPEEEGVIHDTNPEEPIFYSYTDISLPRIHGTTYYYTINKVLNDARIGKQVDSSLPENSICLGHVKTSADRFVKIDTSCIRDIKDLRAPLTELTISYLVQHKHKEINPLDPDRIYLNPVLIVTDWTTTDGRSWSTEEENIEGTLSIVKVNGQFPSIFYRIDTANRQIVFTESIATVDEFGNIEGNLPAIELKVYGISETQGTLPIFRFDDLHARQVKFGRLNKEQIPSINHEGRIFENLIPERFLLERYSNYLFSVVEGTEDIRKNFGSGTAFYDVIASDGNIVEVVDWDIQDDRAVVMFNRPLTSIATVNNLSLTLNIASVTQDKAFKSDKSYHIAFQFVDNKPERWVRITTANAPHVSNPVIDLKKRLRFKLYMEHKSIYMCLGIREISGNYNVGQDGGVQGPIEWVGIESVRNDVAPVGILIEGKNEWQDIDIDIPNARIINYLNGNNSLDTSYGVLEHLAFTIDPEGTDPTGPFEIYIDKLEQVSDIVTAGTSQGIQVSEDFGSTWNVVKLTSTPVYKFYKTYYNQFIWAVGSTEVLLSTDPYFWFQTTGLTGVQNIHDIIDDKDGNMYVSTDKGVYFLDIKLISKFTAWQQTSPVTPFSLDSYALYKNDNEIWVSTEIGIFKTTDKGQTWNDTGIDTAGLIAYKMKYINDLNAIIAITRKHVLRKISTDSNFNIIANFEEQHKIIDIWTFEYYSGKLYISTGNGVFRNSTDLNVASPVEIIFDHTLPDLNRKTKPMVAFGFHTAINDFDGNEIMFICQENRLAIIDSTGKVTIKCELSGEIPTFYKNNEEIKIGYTYGFNKVLSFRKPAKVTDVISCTYLPRQKYYAEYQGWAQTKPLADVFIMLDGDPKWIHFEYNSTETQLNFNVVNNKLNSLPELTDFNSLYPEATSLMNNVKQDIQDLSIVPDLTVITEAQDFINKNNTIVKFIQDYSRFLSDIHPDLISRYELGYPYIVINGADSSLANSRATILQDKEGVIFESCEGIVIDSISGLIDFSINPDKYKFTKYDDLRITIFNAIIGNTGEYVHRELEDKLEERNTGLSSHMSNSFYTNLVKTGIFLEKNNPSMFTRYPVSNIQSKYISTYTTSNWYDKLNSTIDYNLLVKVDNENEIRFCTSMYYFMENPYFLNKIWIGSDNGIVQVDFSNNGVITLENIIHPQEDDYLLIRDIYVKTEDEIYVIISNKQGTSKIVKTIDYGVNWEELDLTNLPDKIYRFYIISGNMIAATENGIFYSNSASPGWLQTDVTTTNRGSGYSDLATNFNEKCFNLYCSNFVIAEIKNGLYISNQGISYYSPGFVPNHISDEKTRVRSVSIVTRFKSLTWLATDKGIYNDNNSILSDLLGWSSAAPIEVDPDDCLVPINDITCSSNALYCGSSNGKIYRFMSTISHPEGAWYQFKVPDFGSVHKMLYVNNDKEWLILISYNKIKVLNIDGDEDKNIFQPVVVVGT